MQCDKTYSMIKEKEECAVESMADYIVTRNLADFANSRVKVILPEEFLKKL